jgi:hypothetical protein
MWLKDHFSYAPARTPTALVGGGQNGTNSGSTNSGQNSSKNGAQSVFRLAAFSLAFLMPFLLL